MRQAKLTATLVAALLLGGCGAEPEPEADRETVFDPLTDTLDRAEEASNAVLEAAEAQRRQLEEEER